MRALGNVLSRAVVSNAATAPVQGGMALLTSALLARYLGPSGYALFAIFCALRASLSLYSDLGGSSSAARFFPEIIAREGRRGAIRLLGHLLLLHAAGGAPLVVALLFGGPWVGHLLGFEPGQERILHYALLTLVADEGSRCAQVFLWARFAHPAVNRAGVVSGVLQTLLVLAVTVLDAGVTGALLATLCAAAARSLLMIRATVRELRTIPRQDPSAGAVPPLMRRLVVLGSATWVEKLSSYFYGSAFLTLVLAGTFPREELGVLLLAIDFTTGVLSLVLSPSNGLILQTFAEIFGREGDSRRDAVFTTTLRGLASVLLPVGTLLVIVGPEAVRLLYSEAFSRAGDVVRILVPFYFAEYSIYSPANAVLIATERIRPYLAAKLIGILTIPLFVVISPVLGLAGVAAIFGCCRLLTAVALLAAAHRTLALPLPLEFYGRLGGISALAAVAGTLAVSLAGADVLSALLGLGVGSIVLIVGMWWARCLGPLEWAVLERLRSESASWFGGRVRA